MLLRREVVAFSLQTAVDFVDVAEVVAAFGGSCPRLDEFKHLVLDVVVWGNGRWGLEQGREVVHELARCDLLYKVGAAILDAGVCEVQCRQLDVGVLVAYALLERAHGLVGLHCLGSNDVGYLEVQRHVLSA